jgi:Zn-dependent protease with chaperone function
MRVLDFIAILLFAWTLVALPVFLLNWFFYIYRCYAKRGSRSRLSGSNRAPMKSNRAFLIPILLLFVVSFLSVSNAREQVRYGIRSLGAGYTVSVNGDIVRNPKDIL